MLKHLLAVFSLILPVCCHAQSYPDSPFYQRISAIPPSAHGEYTPHGTIKANGIVIDLSEWHSIPHTSPEFNGIHGSLVEAGVERNGSTQTFYYYDEYDDLNATFAYDLLVQPEGTDKIKCTFSPLTDTYGNRRKDIPVLALPADLTPLVIKSGDAIAIRTTFPHGDSKAEVIHYLRLTRLDLTSTNASEDETGH